jgi:hypothetical protein
MDGILQQAQSTHPLMFLLVQSSDHVTPATGLSPTVTLSKNGAAFASPAGAVTELANGWYKVAPNGVDCGTLGQLIVHATATGADPTDAVYLIVAFNPDVAYSTYAGGTVAGVAAGVNLNLGQTGLTPRDLGAVPDASLTIGDGLVAAICGAAGKETVTGTSYVVKTPNTGTQIRSFTTDSTTTPTSRN